MQFSRRSRHEAWNVPAILLGSAGGAFHTNQYVDFRNVAERDDESGYTRFGFPMNQFYANILRAFGVPVADFEALSRPHAENATGPFKANSGYGISTLHPDNAFFNSDPSGGPGAMAQHYAGWVGHDMSSWLPLIAG